jgi:hypothetical protein
VGQFTGLDAAGWRRQGQVTINGMIDTAAKRDGALQDWVTSEPDVIARALHEAFVTDLVRNFRGSPCRPSSST